jgi:hypothetical protein
VVKSGANKSANPFSISVQSSLKLTLSNESIRQRNHPDFP